MAACAIRFLEDPALVERLTSNARAEVERYNAPHIRQEWVPLYHQIAAARTSATQSRRTWSNRLRVGSASADRSIPAEGAGIVQDQKKTEANGRRLRVLLIAPSIEILGGQAVQATRLLASLRDEPSVEMEFQPIDPQLAGPFHWLKRIKFVRTAIRSLL